MNQSETNPLATALAALMTGHNANPNTSLRIPLVDSNGNLQPGPTLAELASVLGAITNSFSLKNASDANSETGQDGVITLCQVRSNFANYPRSNPRGFLIVCRINAGYVNQAYWDTRTAEIYTRSINSSSTWTDWKLVEAT